MEEGSVVRYHTVLILIVLEFPFGPALDKAIDTHRLVLILIVLEFPFGLYKKA